MKKKIILWGILMVLVVGVIGFLLYQSLFSKEDSREPDIPNLFTDQDSKLVFLLQNKEVEITPGEVHGIAFAMRNEFDIYSNFNYNIEYVHSTFSCQISDKSYFDSWIESGWQDSIEIEGDEHFGIIGFNIPRGAPNPCTVRYSLNVTCISGGEDIPYASEFFEIIVV